MVRTAAACSSSAAAASWLLRYSTAIASMATTGSGRSRGNGARQVPSPRTHTRGFPISLSRGAGRARTPRLHRREVGADIQGDRYACLATDPRPATAFSGRGGECCVLFCCVVFWLPPKRFCVSVFYMKCFALAKPIPSPPPLGGAFVKYSRSCLARLSPPPFVARVFFPFPALSCSLVSAACCPREEALMG